MESSNNSNNKKNNEDDNKTKKENKEEKNGDLIPIATTNTIDDLAFTKTGTCSHQSRVRFDGYN